MFFFTFSRTTAIYSNINIDNQGARVLSFQNFANQFKCITWEKFRVFALKVATSGPYKNLPAARNYKKLLPDPYSLCIPVYDEFQLHEFVYLVF